MEPIYDITSLPPKPPTDPKCDHSYTLRSGKVFRCDTDPHPTRPAEHYFVRDKRAEDRREAERLRTAHQPNRLVSVPGDR